MSATKPSRHGRTFGAGAVVAVLLGGPAFSQSLSYLPIDRDGAILANAAPEGDQTAAGDELPAPLRRQIVSYPSNEAPGTIIIDTAHTFLYLTLGSGKAMRYGIGVGREGFTWSGTESISRKSEWPDWIPPAEMIARQPYLPRWVGGGPGNPLGARALYLGNIAYRIHGTNNPRSIGKHVSSGCIRLQDADVIDLYGRVGVGTKVVVLPGDEKSASIKAQRRPPADNQRHVSIEGDRGAAMTARITVAPATEQVGPAAQLSSNSTPAGLY